MTHRPTLIKNEYIKATKQFTTASTTKSRSPMATSGNYPS